MAISSSIDSIGEFCAAHGVDAWFKKAGYVYAATAPQHLAVGERMVGLAGEVGAADELGWLSAAEVRAGCDSASFRGGAFMRDGASVQPARLVRGLRRVLLERGVTIHEGTTATRLVPGPPAVAVTPQGLVRAPNALIAVNAWARGRPGLRRP